jgi:sulfatase maturation enzyme AslB (radical SAM superfamily)
LVESIYQDGPGHEFYVGHETDKEVPEGSAVNVIYFTNKCNLACTYCYEDLPGRPPQIMTKQDIIDSVDSVLAREDPDSQTLFCLFGGEPTLEWENVKFCMEYAYSKKRNVHFNMTTNGIKFLSSKFLKEVMDNKFYKYRLLSIDISFDGLGNQDRIYHDGSASTPSMIKVLRNVAKANMRWRLRYTIQKENIDFWYEDITKLANTFNPSRIITSVAWSTLDEDETARLKLKSGKELFRADWINKAIAVPICELFCDMCSGCGERKQLKTYYTDEGNVTTYGNYENAPEFHDFKEKEIENE